MFVSNPYAPGLTTHKISYQTDTGKDTLAFVSDDSSDKTDGSALQMKSYKAADGTTYVPKAIHTYENMTFRYGYLEMRAKVPNVKSAWPSFWLRSGDAKAGKPPFGEIDIFEVYGTRDSGSESNPGVATTAMHKWLGNEFNDIPDDNGHCSSNAVPEGFVKFGNKSTNFDPDVYHTFAIDWTPTSITFYIDGNMYYKVDMTVDMCGHDINNDGKADHYNDMSCFNDQEFFIVFCNEVFNETAYPWIADQCISTNENFEATYSIDYVRLYQNPVIGETITFHGGCVH